MKPGVQKVKVAHPGGAHRPYHSRWAISVYGKEPGVPDEDYEGYEESLEEFANNGEGGEGCFTVHLEEGCPFGTFGTQPFT